MDSNAFAGLNIVACFFVYFSYISSALKEIFNVSDYLPVPKFKVSHKQTFDLLLFSNFFPKSRIISFEPLKAPSDKYNKLFKDDEDVIMYKSAIGIYQKKLSMHISKKTDSSSILPIGENQASIFPGTEESHIENITIAPLRKFIKYDDLISPVFVKIDVQGYELEVLKGCKEFLEYFNYIYVECSFIELYKGQAFFDEVYDFLSKYSFKLSGVYNVFYDNKGLAVQGDFLFIKKK